MAVAKEREKIGSDDRATEVHPKLRRLIYSSAKVQEIRPYV